MTELRTKRLLVISSAEDEESTSINNDFIAKLQPRLDEGSKIQWVNYHSFRVEFKTGKLEVFLASENIPLNDFDFVYFKSFFRYSEFAGVIASYLEQESIPFVCSELKNHIPLTKLTQLSRLALNDLPIADTIFMLNQEFKNSFKFIGKKLGVPFIFKSIDGSGGDENFLIEKEDQVIKALNKFPDLKFIAQKFIPNDSDLRALIVDKKIELIIKRQRADASTHLNNTSQGASSQLLPLDDLSVEHQDISLKAAEVMDREIAGVDLMFDKNTHEPYILEVNASPQIGSGAFIDEKLDIYSNYFNNMLKYTN